MLLYKKLLLMTFGMTLIFYNYQPIFAHVSLVISFFQVSPPNFVYHLMFPVRASWESTKTL